jgi:holo-[acyl-carrier protein] synthase
VRGDTLDDLSVVGLGVDLVEKSRVRASLARWGERLVRKLMDPEEAARLPSGDDARALALAQAVAAKEAASKALGTGWSRGVRWRDVVLLPGPSVRLLARAGERARALGSRGETRTRLLERGDLVIGEVRLLGP